MTPSPATDLLSVQHLSASVRTRTGVRDIIRDVSFTVGRNEVVAIVGESGCGKSITVQAVTRLLGPQVQVSGDVDFDGAHLLGLSEPQLRKIRATRIGTIFQDPMASLNPLLSIGYQLAEAMRGLGTPAAQCRVRALDLLKLVGLSDVERRYSEYPHELSGGMRQRVMIAMALMGSPQLLIADEPTTALDVTIQAQILDLLASIRQQTGISILIITHDLGVVAELADRVVVMYAGQVVESAATVDILSRPRHPYTRALLSTIPRPGARRNADRIRLNEIAGTVPANITGLKGCAFAPRCGRAQAICGVEPPALEALAGRSVRCFFPETDMRGGS